MTPIRTQRLILRNWLDRDRDLFHRINSDDRVMEFFPHRRGRDEADTFLDHLRADIQRKGYGFAAAEIAATGACIGFVGLKATDLAPHIAKSQIEIGWRLAPEFWGHGYVTEAGEAWLDYGFQALGEDEICSFAVWTNRRSTAVMERLGMRRDPNADFEHPHIPDTHPHLAPHVVYRLTRDEWLQRKKAAKRPPS